MKGNFMFMISRFKKSLSCLLIGASSALMISSASASSTDDKINQYLEEMESVEVQVLPFNRLVFSRETNTDTGEFLLTSDNGRYVFQGRVIDQWNEIEINSYEDAVFSASHLDISSIDMKPSDVGSITYGSGDQHVFAFVSPSDPSSRKLLEQIKHLDKEFTFHFAVIPYADTPNDVTLSYACPANEAQAVQSLFSNTDYEKIGISRNCDPAMLTYRLIAIQLLGIQDVPAVIAPSTRLQQGDFNSWEGFLLNNKI